MKIMFEKKAWFKAKAKLQGLYDFLTDQDFQYEPGKEDKVPEKIRKILHMPQREFYKLIGMDVQRKDEEQSNYYKHTSLN